MYQIFLKESNGFHKFLRYSDLRENNFEVTSSEIALDKVYLKCVETVKSKSTGKDPGFITYSNTIKFSIKYIYNSGYIITQ